MTADLVLPFDGAQFADNFVRAADPVNITASPMPIGGLAWGAGPLGGVGSGAIHVTGGVARTAGAGTSPMIAFTAPAAVDLSLYTEFGVLGGSQVVGPAFCVQNASNFYYVAARSDGWRIYRYNAATSTHGPITQTVHGLIIPASGHAPIVDKIRDQVQVTVNGVLSLSATIDADMIGRDRVGLVLTGGDTSSVAEIAVYRRTAGLIT